MFVRIVSGLRQHRKTLLFGAIGAALFFQFGCVPAVYESAAGTQDANDDVHYLAAYGDWQTVAPFGMVWCPNVVSDWQPFTYGHWTWSYDGWAWVSYEPFGWLVYNYGNWYYSQDIGWFWVPGDTWSPAQVEWYSFGDYCSWAPLPPPGVSWPELWEPNGVNFWVTVNAGHLTDENVGRLRLKTPVSREIVEREGVVKRPPAVDRVQTLEKRTIKPVTIKRRSVDIRPQTPQVPPEAVRTQNPDTRPQTPQAPPEAVRTQNPDTRPQAPQAPSKAVRTGNPQRERMVLPQADKRKVQRNQPKVEREVLVPKRPAPPEHQGKDTAPDSTKKT
ncbi:MAG: DUF6600 domain-containing protein, partial [Candidatus Krumholzibacteriaceae bacterium]